MLTMEEAIERIAEAVGTPDRRTERVEIDAALGRTLATDVRMDHDVPPFSHAAMDGFAVGEAVGPGTTLRVVATVAAGSVPTTAVGPGTAVRIMTGAPIPSGTVRVVPFEWTRSEGDVMVVDRVPSEASHVVPIGDHVGAGEVVLPAGRRLDAGALSALATAGCLDVEVALRPRVAVIGTGSELVHIRVTPGPGQVRNSNSVLVRGQARRAGAEPVDLGTVVDSEDELRWAIRKGIRNDVLVLTGGVSRGDLDLVPGAFRREEVTEIFHRWKVQPGGPLWFGMHGRTLVFGLPGNPAASYVCFELAVVPAIRGLLGLPVRPRPALRARYQGPRLGASDRRRYRPARIGSADDGGLVAVPLPWSGSGDPFVAARGATLVALPETEYPEGTEPLVDVLLLEPRS